jgi:uncharacterized protein
MESHMKLYLDACAIIYAVEGNPALRSATRDVINKILPGGSLITSRLSRLECRVKPLRDKNSALLDRYELVFGSREMSIIELSTEVVERATDLRATYNFKAPDALHLASAIHEKADVFLTGDAGLERCSEIKIWTIPVAGS